MEEKISPIRAVSVALFGEEPRTFPIEDGTRLEPGAISKRIRGELDQLSANVVKDANFATLFEKAKDSLEEAKALTEYQDQKVSRLLTVVAFLSAAAGTIFGKFADRFPLQTFTWIDVPQYFVVLAYVLFFAFVLVVAAGALVSFYATRTRFVWDASSPNVVKHNSPPKSLLFFQESIRSSPEQWAKSFARIKSESDELLLEYYKNYVIESYLINSKVADKIRLLEPAQVWLWRSIRLLLAWLILVGALYIAVIPAKADGTSHAIAPLAPASSMIATPPPTPVQESVALHFRQENNPNVVVNCGAQQSPTTRPPAPKPPSCIASCVQGQSEKTVCK